MLVMSDGDLDKIKHGMQLRSEGHREMKRCRMLLLCDSENRHLSKSKHAIPLPSGEHAENKKHLLQLSCLNIKTRSMLEKEKHTMQYPQHLVPVPSGKCLNMKTRSMLVPSGECLNMKTRSMLEKEKHKTQLSSEGNLVKNKHLMQLSSEGNLDKNKRTVHLSSGELLDKKKQLLQSSEGHVDRIEHRTILSSGGHLEKRKHPLAFEQHMKKTENAVQSSPKGRLEKAKHPLDLSSERQLITEKHLMQLLPEGQVEKNKLMHLEHHMEEINSFTESVEDQMKVYFRLMHLIPFEVKKQDTVEKVITEVSDSEGLSIKTVCFQGNWLEGEQKLVDYNVMNGSVINVFVDSEFRIKIHVTLASSKKTLTLDVDKRNSIHSIKGKIQNKEGFTASQFDLIYLGEGLDDRRTLADYNIEEGSTIDALFHVADSIQIYINLKNNRTICLQVKSWYTGKDVKHVIQSMVGIPLHEQKLYFGQVKMKNHRTVADLGIRQGQTLHLFSGTCLCVQTSRGEELLFEVDEPPTIDKVQSLIQAKENMPIAEIPKLVFYGKQFHKDTRALTDSDAGNKAALYWVLPPL